MSTKLTTLDLHSRLFPPRTRLHTFLNSHDNDSQPLRLWYRELEAIFRQVPIEMWTDLKKQEMKYRKGTDKLARFLIQDSKRLRSPWEAAARTREHQTDEYLKRVKKGRKCIECLLVLNYVRGRYIKMNFPKPQWGEISQQFYENRIQLPTLPFLIPRREAAHIEQCLSAPGILCEFMEEKLRHRVAGFCTHKLVDLVKRWRLVSRESPSREWEWEEEKMEVRGLLSETKVG